MSGLQLTDVAMEYPHDLVQPSHMLHQAGNCDATSQYLCAGKEDKTVLGLRESLNHHCFILQCVSVSSHLPMQSSGEDLESGSSRNLLQRAINGHSFGLAERRTRLHHALVASNQGLAASDIQGQEVGYLHRFCNRVSVSGHSQDQEMILNLPF